ncbi:glycosyltransferase [Geomonas terrae]|uniref:Glycosyltransferase n=1 Tax=Geomonas terrae TaxID=2562681 RepID=A0A4S1CMV8_9BACT|nr:glycosyltransferase [Geomonas terrae]TGU74973.1 glycosyltransferase [Geomonas terrae]
MQDDLEVNFFTIVLNGEPFIRWHIEQFKKLTFPWHWHVVEGVADLKHDTAWSLENGGRVSEELHRNGLSNDGTTAYLDELARLFPDRVTLYRKPAGVFWDGKLEMVAAPLGNIRRECLLWQIDADEFWTAPQIETARAMFQDDPSKTSAFYYCNFYVGPELVISTRDTYGNHSHYEWLRTWHYLPGDQWVSHEPPRLCRPKAGGGFGDLGRINPFRHAETERQGLTFEHLAYVTEPQLRFKEIYYGYADAVAGWRRLQQAPGFPVRLADYFPWVHDGALVRRKDDPVRDLPGGDGETGNIIFLRPDSIGDSVLAASMLPHIKARFPSSSITVVCQSQVGELYDSSPYVDAVIRFDREKAMQEEDYRNLVVRQIAAVHADIALYPVYSRDALYDLFTIGSGARTRVAMRGNLSNLSAEVREQNDPRFTHLIESDGDWKPELERNRDFLAGIDIVAPPLQPMIWLTEDDRRFAEEFFAGHRLEGRNCIAVFAGAQSSYRNYEHFGKALAPICRENDFTLIAVGSAAERELGQKNLDESGATGINMCGKLTLRQVAAIISRCRLAVGAETGTAHIACAVGTPNVILLGGGHFGRFMPYTTLTTVACLPLACYRCDWRCPYAKAHCVKDVNPAVLTAAIASALAGPSDKIRMFCQDRSEWLPLPGEPAWQDCDGIVDRYPVEIVPVTQFTPVAPERRGGSGSDSLMEKGKGYLVSAIVSTYDAERFLRGKLEDLEAQTIADRLEIIVIDAASPGNERAIVEEFQRRYDNIRYLRTERRETVYQAWNRGIRMATGEFVTNANTDDRLRGDAYEILVRTLREHPECVLAYPDMRITQQENATFAAHESHGFRDWPDFDRLGLLELCCVGPFPLWRRSLHDEIGYFDERFKSAADYEFWLRAALGHDFVHVPQFLGLYWLSPDTVSRKGDLPTLEYLQVQKEYRPRYAPLTPPPVAPSPEEQEAFQRLLTRLEAGDPAAPGEVENFLKRHPRAAQPHHELALLLHRRGDIGLAKTHFEKAVLLDPASERYREGLRAFQAKELSEPLHYYLEQADAAPENLEHQLCAGAILTLLGRFKEARTYYLRAKSIAPESPLAAGYLAFLEGSEAAGRTELAAQAAPRRSPGARSEGVLVSAIVSTYNSERFIRGCLEDLEAQTIAHRMEIIVVDSASPQNEAAVVAEFQKRYDNIRYIRTAERETLYAAWNRGVEAARGTFLTNANTDDRHRPDALEVMAAALEANPEVDLVYGDCYVSTVENQTYAESAHDRLFRYPDFLAPASLLHYQLGPQPMWRRSVHEKIGLFDGSFHAAGDYDFNIRFALACKALHLPEALGLYLEAPTAISFRDNRMGNENVLLRKTYHNEETVFRLYRATGLPCDSDGEKAQALLDLGIRALRFYPPWKEGAPERDPELALFCFQRAAALSGNAVAPWNNLAVAAFQEGERDLALDILQRLASRSAEEAVTWNLRLVTADRCAPTDLKLMPSGFSFPSQQELVAGLPDPDGPPAEKAPLPSPILLVCHGYPPGQTGGTELYVASLARELRLGGAHVVVLVPGHAPDRPEGEIVEHEEGGILVAEMNVPPAVGPQGVRQLREQFHNDRLAAHFEHFLQRIKPRLVHFHHFIDLSASLLDAAARAGVPSVVTLHDGWAVCPLYHFFRPDGTYCEEGPVPAQACVRCLTGGSSAPGDQALEELLKERRDYIQSRLLLADTVLFPSRFMLEKLRRHGLDHPRCVVHPLGLTELSPLPRKSGTPGRVRFGYIGHVHPVKGLDVLMRAANLLRPGKAELAIFGEVRDPVYFRAAGGELNAPVPVTGHGTYLRSELPGILASIDVAVIPSRNESFCQTARECLQAGVPVIASDAGALPEAVRHGVNGLLFHSGDHVDLAARMNAVIDDPALLAGLRAGITPVKTSHDEVLGLSAIYAAVLDRRRTPESGAGSVSPASDAPRGTGGEAAEVTIVIPVFNGADLTENCLRAIAANTPKGMYRVVIVDNGSQDGTRELLERLRAPEMTVIGNAENLGFAKACNQGAQAAGGEFILFLNNDTLPHPGWLERLVAMARQDATIGVVGSKLLYPDDRVQHAGVVVGLRDGEPYPYHVHLCEPSGSPLVNVPHEYQMVTGACLMIRSGLFRQVGGFDEAYVNGHEDLDLCMKARAAGAKVMYCPSSVVTHLESRTKRLIGLEQFHYEKGVDNEEGRGRRRFLDRWRETLQIDGEVLAGAGGHAPVPAPAQGLSILFTMYGWDETGGGTTFPRSVALELARQGHRVTVFYASLATDPARPEYALETHMEEGVRLFALFNRPARFTDPDHPEREMLDEGVLRAFRQVLSESAPDVVHFHNFHGLTLAMAQETRLAGIPSVYTPHNYHMIDPDLYLFNSDLSLWNGTDLIANSEAVARNPEKVPQYRLRGETTKRLLNEWVDVTLAVSMRQKELLVAFGASPERIAVVHQASRSTDLLWQDPALATLGARVIEKPLRFGFIGGVMPHKGVHMLVGAAQLFQPGEAEFHVYGFVSAGYLDELRELDRRGMVVFHGAYGEADLPAIAAGIDVAVAPSVWEDCAPLVLLELMALRLPIIGARIGGIPDFVEEGVNGFLYRHDSLAELVACLKRCAADPCMVAEMRGSLASPHSFSRYLGHLEEIYRLLKERRPLLLPELELRVRLGAKQAPAPLPAVVWEGSQFVGHSLALVNRELCLQLIGDGYPLSIIPYEEDQFGAEADPRFHLLAEAVRRPLPAAPAVHVRHQWPPDFTPPPQGRWVMIQPWEFGSLPVRWVEAMNGMVDEVWVPSSYVRDCYLRSGVRPERVFTVPNGVNTALFNPQAPPITLKTQKRFKFLFVGGTIARKGIDILLQAYSAAFTGGDDVCLVIKDMGGGSFYQGRTAQELIARYRQNPDLPEVEYLDRFLPDRELAGLYTACDCLVHPYRGEGFGLPMAEAMACGLAVVVTGHGAALDFCSAETAYLIPAREVKLPMKQVGELETVDHPWLAEPDAAALADIMRHVAEHPDEARERGRAAARHIARNFTWEKAAACVRARLAALSEDTAPRSEAPRARREEGLLCSIVIETAGALENMERCLDSIARHTQERHEVLLSHHGGQEAARLEKLARRHAECRLVDGSTRLADADPYHAGIVQARGDVLVLMEPDVVVTPGWLAGMLVCLDREAGAGIVGPMGDGATGLQRARGPETVDEAALDEFARSFAAQHARRRIQARMLDPFCMLLTRTALKAAGEPDARLRRGDRGGDLCLRAALAGFRCVVAGDVFLHRLPSTGPADAPEAGKLSFREKWALGGLEPELAKRVASRQALFLAQQLARQGSLDAAVDLFLQQGIALAPTEPAPYLLLAEALLDAGSFKNALEVLEQVPAGAELQRLYLDWRCRSALGQEKEALARTEAIVQLAPETPLALYLQGKAAAGRGDAAGAEALFRRSCQADPGFAPPWLELALLHRERGEYGEALDLAEKGFMLAPLDLPGLALFHGLAEDLSELPREEKRVREACRLYPEHKGLCFGLVEVLIRQGHHLQALEELERAAVSYGLDDAALDAALEIRKLAGPDFPDSPCRAAVSLCMIVKDERRHLPAALASVKPFVSEIVVVDTGSTDRSGDLARLFGARVFDSPWNGDFSEARNVSLSQATGEWILVLDADEVLAARDLPRLQELLSRAGSAAFSIITRNYTAEVTRKHWTANAGEYPAEERGLGWTPSLKVRLFPNDARVRFQGAVHELVEGTLAQCGIPVLSCDIPVHHYGKLDNAKCAEKQEHYYLLGMKKLSQGGATVEALTELAIQATELARFSEAEELWRRVLELTPEAAEPYFNLGYLYLSLGDYRKAREHALKGAELAPEMKEAAFNLAKAELYLGDTERASAGCRDMLLKWPEYPPALSLLCVCRLLAGEAEEAEAIVRRLTQLGYDCVDFLAEYAAGLARGERGELAAPVRELAQRLERRGSAQ